VLEDMFWTSRTFLPVLDLGLGFQIFDLGLGLEDKFFGLGLNTCK